MSGSNDSITGKLPNMELMDCNDPFNLTDQFPLKIIYLNVSRDRLKKDHRRLLHYKDKFKNNHSFIHALFKC